MTQALRESELLDIGCCRGVEHMHGAITSGHVESFSVGGNVRADWNGIVGHLNCGGDSIVDVERQNVAGIAGENVSGCAILGNDQLSRSKRALAKIERNRLRVGSNHSPKTTAAVLPGVLDNHPDPLPS